MLEQNRIDVVERCFNSDQDYGALQLGWSKITFYRHTVLVSVTYQARAGWYLDGMLMGGLFNGHVRTVEGGDVVGLPGSTVGASIEGGYPIGFKDSLAASTLAIGHGRNAFARTHRFLLGSHASMRWRLRADEQRSAPQFQSR